MIPNEGDIRCLQMGLKRRKPSRSGLRFYTGHFDHVSLLDHFRGRSAFLVLSGPSLNQLDLSQLNRRGIVTMGVNNSWTVYRPNLWTCVDPPGRFIDTGWKDPGILKFIPTGLWPAKLRFRTPTGQFRDSSFRAVQMPGVYMFRRSNTFDHRTFLDDECIQWGGTGGQPDSVGIKGARSVMLVAIRLLYHLGFRNVYLIGADFRMTEERGYAFSETREASAVRHNNHLYKALQIRLEALRPMFNERGFRVINATPQSGLTAFETMSYADAIAEASAECSKPIDTTGWYTAIKKAGAK